MASSSQVLTTPAAPNAIAATIFMRPVPSITQTQQTLPTPTASETLSAWWCEINTAISNHPVLAAAALVGLYALAKPIKREAAKLTASTRSRRTR
jgi:hypothetical protein